MTVHEKLNEKPSFSKAWLSQAPANTMIMGEHSVVYGQPAIACALDQWLSIEWQPLAPQKAALGGSYIEIHSDLGAFSGNLKALSEQKSFQFIYEALRYFSERITQTLCWRLKIRSDFSSTIGLGSSAAVLSAALTGLNAIYNLKLSKQALFGVGHQIIIKIQGRGSGTDLAASLFGGMLYFQPKQANRAASSNRFQSLNISLPIRLIYSGYKTPTAEVLELVARKWQDRPEELNNIYQKMGDITRNAFAALKANHLERFYLACNAYQLRMRELGVSDDTLEFLLNTLAQCPGIQTQKISGSGLGDCVLAVGDLHDCPDTESVLSQYQQLTLPIATQGAYAQPIKS